VRGTEAEPIALTTRQQTVRPVAIPPGTPQVLPKDVSLYGVHGYSAWQLGPGEDAGRRFDLMPAGYAGAANAARLLSFFSMSDIHITDKESPAQVPYYGWNAPFQTSGLYSQAYSPVLLATTQVLDAAVKTVNALHRQSPFDFGIMLGDVANSSQFNELRWFIDVIDGKYVIPTSGAQLGVSTIDYQKPFQAAGLDRSIPWYAVIGNHDEFWMGVNFPSEKLRNAMVGSDPRPPALPGEERSPLARSRDSGNTGRELGEADCLDAVAEGVAVLAGMNDPEVVELQVGQCDAHGLGGRRGVVELEFEADAFAATHDE
jgi:hypothetical protein